MAKITINLAQSPPDIASVRALFLEYLQVLKVDFGNEIGCAAGQEDMTGFPDNYEALLLARLDGEAVAACGLKRINNKDCELGKLYCRPAGRGHALGRCLTETALEHARAQGYKRVVLSTEPVMKHAVGLYLSMGFKDVENYACEGGGCSRFMAFAF